MSAPQVRMTDLARRALAVNEAMLSMGNETFQAEGATFVRNRSTPAIRDGNHVAHVRAATPGEIDRLLAHVEREYAGFGHRSFQIDLDTPPQFEARLAHEGYESNDALVMLLEGDPAGEPGAHDIRLIDGDDAWRAYAALHEMDWAEYVQGLEDPEEAWVAEEMFRHRRIKSPPVRFWLACVDGSPRAYCASWEGIDGVGQVEDLFTQPDFRRRGLAAALIHHCVADCRERGAGPVVIVADPDDTPKHMYAAMGFRPVAVKRAYWRKVAR